MCNGRQVSGLAFGKVIKVQLLSDCEEKKIKQILDKTDQLHNLSSTCKEKKLAEGMVIDRLWTVKLKIFQETQAEEIPVIGFEIEKVFQVTNA